jgi:hypothetical protein
MDETTARVIAAHYRARDAFTLSRKLHAAAMVAARLPTPTAGSQPHVFPGVSALVMSHTLMEVAGRDGEMRLWASDMEWGARHLIRLYLGWADDGLAN